MVATEMTQSLKRPTNKYRGILKHSRSVTLHSINGCELKQGMVLITDHKGRTQPVRLQLAEETLTLQKEELVYVHSSADEAENAGVTRERIVTVKRERVGGLGLSVKGGIEHHLPILISRIFKDQAADKTGQLFVGDAIVRVNDIHLEKYSHDAAVQCLKDAGDTVTLTVKHFRPASLFLARNRNSGHIIPPVPGSQSDDDGRTKVPPGYTSLPKLEKHWADVVCLKLHYAMVTRYAENSDKIRTNGFQVSGVDGTSTGMILCEDGTQVSEWIRCINHNITALTNQTMTVANRLLLPNDQIIHMCWVGEKLVHNNHSMLDWKSRFLSLRGSNIYIFDRPPHSTRDWLRCEEVCKVYESMFRLLKDAELLDEREHCFTIQTGTGDSYYMSLETRVDVLGFEKAWYRSNYLAILHLKSKTFGCTWRNRICGLTLDLNSGFSLYDSQNRCFMWNYKFSQLKGSSDDGKSKLKLLFLRDTDGQDTDTREIECTNLQALLFTMHAFLSAKLASVDPTFLRNI